MRNKTLGVSTKKSVVQLPKIQENILDNQMISPKINRKNQEKIALNNSFNNKLGTEANWFEAEIDNELEIFEIDESDFQFRRDEDD